MLSCTSRCVVGHEALENEWYVIIKAYKFTVFEIFFVYCMSTLSLHIESIDSIINCKLRIDLQCCMVSKGLSGKLKHTL